MITLAQTIPTAEQASPWLDLVKTGGMPLVVFAVIVLLMGGMAWLAWKLGAGMFFRMCYDMVMAIKETVVRLEIVLANIKPLQELPKSAEMIGEHVQELGKQNGRLTNIVERFERAQ